MYIRHERSHAGGSTIMLLALTAIVRAQSAWCFLVQCICDLFFQDASLH